MMKEFGYEVIVYGNEPSDVVCSEFVPILSAEEHARVYPPPGHGEFEDKNSTIGNEGWYMFAERTRSILRDRAKPGDIVCHTFGQANAHLVRDVRQAIHVETFVGSNEPPFGAFRVFESESWKHYTLGRFELMRHPATNEPLYVDEPGLAHNLCFVIPNARDPGDWPLGTGEGDYCLFMGRLIKAKGLDTIANIIKAWDRKHPNDDMRFVFAGQGEISGLVEEVQKQSRALMDRVDYRGVVTGRDRAKLIGDARCMLCPTNYVEPGGGSAIEALMCGTPVVASDWGCFTESVRQGKNGFRCKTLADWIRGIEMCGSAGLPDVWRQDIRDDAEDRFSTEVAAPLYDRAFRQLRDILANGPESTESFNVP